MKSFICHVLLYFPLLGCAQNLIPNGDLENGSGVDFFTMPNWNRFETTPDAYTGLTSWGSPKRSTALAIYGYPIPLLPMKMGLTTCMALFRIVSTVNMTSRS
jgi:hypothetical protein